VKLQIKRSNRVMNFTLQRATISVPAIDSQLIEQKILYVRINKFTPNLKSLIDSVLSQVPDGQTQGYILDLRSNPGGYVESAVDVADVFLPAKKEILSLNYRQLQQKRLTLYNNARDIKPMYILINRGTASASEILAASLQEHFNAKLIGEQSFGKGTFQELKYFQNSSALKLTIGQWLAPNGIALDEVGLTPDIYVKTTLNDIQSGNDPVLNKALQLLGL